MENSPPRVSGFAELTLETADLSRIERFYRDVLGLEVLAREADRIWMAVGDHSRLGLWSPGSEELGDRGGRHVNFAFAVSPGGLDALSRRLREAGAEVRGPVEHPGDDRSIYCRDPAGNLVEAWDFFARHGVRALA